MSDERFLERIAESTAEQARSTTQLVEIQRNMVARLDKIHELGAESVGRLRSVDDHLGRMDKARDEAIEHLKSQIRARKNGSRLIGWLLAAAATVIAAALSALALSGRR